MERVGVVSAYPGCFTPLPLEPSSGFKHKCLHTIITTGHRPSPDLCTTMIKLNGPDDNMHINFKRVTRGAICTPDHQQRS